MNTNEEKLRNWATKELGRANEALNSPVSRFERYYAIAGFLLIPYILFARSEMNGWPQSVVGWLLFATTLAAFVFGMQLLLWAIRTIAAWTPVRIQHWARVILGVVLVPLAFWGCTQLFALLKYGYT